MSLYVPIVVLAGLAAVFAIFSLVAGSLPAPSGGTGPSSRPTSAASSRPRQPSGSRFPVKYYLTAMLFIVFDIEIIFLYPWAVAFDRLGRVRAGRDGHLHRHGSGRVRLRVAARRSGVGLAMGLEEKLPSGILLTTVEKVVGYARKNSVWPATFGLACCAIELMATGGPRHDLARFGMERASQHAAAGRPDDRGRAGEPEDGAGAAADLRPDGRAQVGDLDGRLRLQRRHVQQLRDRAGRRSHRAGGHLPAGLPAAAGDAAGRHPQAARQDPEHEARREPGERDRPSWSRPGCGGCRWLPACRPRRTGHRHAGTVTPTSTGTPAGEPRPISPGRRRRARPPEAQARDAAGRRPGAAVRAGRADRHVRRPRPRATPPATAACRSAGRRRCPARGRTAGTSTTSPTRSAARWTQAGSSFGDAIERVVADRGELTFHVRREHLTAVARRLRDDPALAFELCPGVSGVHYPADDRAASCTRSTTWCRSPTTGGCGWRCRAPDADPHIPSLVERIPDLRLARAGDLGLLRDRLRRAPGADQDRDAGRLEGPPAAEGLPAGRHPGRVPRRHGPAAGRAEGVRMTDSRRLTPRAEGRVYNVGGADWDEVVAAAGRAGDDRASEHIVVNMGPQHPSTHGVLRLILTLDGETVTELRPVIGYLHTGIEKNMEFRTWTQGVTFMHPGGLPGAAVQRDRLLPGGGAAARHRGPDPGPGERDAGADDGAEPDLLAPDGRSGRSAWSSAPPPCSSTGSASGRRCSTCSS